MRRELVLALAKSGDREVAPELLEYAGIGNLVHKRFLDAQLRKLTGIEFGEIETEDDARAVFRSWRFWVERRYRNRAE